MKKISFYTIAAAIVAVAGWNVMQSSNDAVLSDVALANVEALADESDDCFFFFERCGTNCPYEWCGYCYGYYLTECLP